MEPNLINEENNNIFEDKENEYWLICPTCKTNIPIIHLFIATNEQVKENDEEKEIDILYADIRCKNEYCKPITIPFEIYLDFVKKNGKMIKPEIIDKKLKNKELNKDKNVIYCMDQHGYINNDNYMMHNIIKFKFPHVVCEKELNIDSYCKLNKNHEYLKKAKYFCLCCNLALCKPCKIYHEKEEVNHPISELENETVLIDYIFEDFKQNIKDLDEENKKLNINKLIIDYVFLLKNNYDRIAIKHIPNCNLILNFKLLHKMEKNDKYLINSKAHSLNYSFEDIKQIEIKSNDFHILRLDEVNNHNKYSFLLYSNTFILLCNYHNNIFKNEQVKRVKVESTNGILKKINEDKFYIFINNDKKNESSLLINLDNINSEKYNISKSDYCSSYFNIWSLDNVIGGINEGKIKILNIDDENKKLKVESSIDFKKNKDAKVLEAIHISNFPYKLYNFEEVKKVAISEEEIEVIVCSTDKDFLGVIYMKKTFTKNNKLKIELDLIWKLTLTKGKSNENVIKCICDLEKGFCFATEENEHGFLHIYNEVLSIEKDKFTKKYENKIKIGVPIKSMCKTDCNYILATVDVRNDIKFWDLRYLVCVNYFQTTDTKKIPDIKNIIFVKNNYDEKKFYDLIMITNNKDIIIYRSNFKNELELDSNLDDEEYYDSNNLY